jgi:dienelactone hydrolase
VYQGIIMHRLNFISATALLASSLAFAQTPAQPPAPTPSTLRPRAAAGGAPLVRADQNSAANAGRRQLYEYLDAIAAKDNAARRATVAAIHTRAEAEARQREVRKKIITLLGGFPEKTPLNARTLGTTKADGYSIEKVLFDSQPNFPVTALLYLPDNRPGKLPGIVIAPGHGATGKASDFTMASTFARNGFAVLSYDPIGQGERMMYPDPAHPGQDLASRPTGEHGEAGLQPTLIGDAVARYFAWDGMRAVDYLMSRPEVDAARIGAFGCSGGGAMTALLAALDNRVAASAIACYTTNYDTLLPSIGPQDAEQSIPGFIPAGPAGPALDFPDWVELAAPRPYAIVGTVSDMFPWAGLLTTAQEARRFYAIFNPAAEGTPTGNPMPPTPTGPTLNPDTSNTIPATAPLQVIAGIGGHGNLGPITSQIVSFFLINLAHSTAAPNVPPPPARGAGFSAPTGLPDGALQVTPTGQVLTSYPTSETVHTLNLKHAATKLPAHRAPLTLPQLQAAIRDVTDAVARPGGLFTVTSHSQSSELPAGKVSTTTPKELQPGNENFVVERLTLHEPDGYDLPAFFVSNQSPTDCPGTLLVEPELTRGPDASPRPELIERMLKLAKDGGSCVLAITPRPSPPGTEETKSPILGPFYMTELRAEINGRTILGLRLDDITTATDYLAHQAATYPRKVGEREVPITAVASGHMGLVLLHAAVLDPRLKHITIDHTLESYASLLQAPMPLDAPQDILPGVLLHYDIPDLTRALGPRLTFTTPLPGTANLATP